MNNIPIIFVGGAHGNFLEFVCNKFYNVMLPELTNCNPFDEMGASHSKTNEYMNNRVFRCYHYMFSKNHNDNITHNGKIIHINIQPFDILLLSQVSLLRAGNYNYNSNDLEYNTYNKLNNNDYSWVLATIQQKFFKDQIENSYNAIRDESWPSVTSMDEFNRLPDWIKNECISDHNIILHQLSIDSPHCMRYILREFFKYGFKNPTQHGFLEQQNIVKSSPLYNEANVFDFEYASFYHIDDFINELTRLGIFIDETLSISDEFYKLHDEFLSSLIQFMNSVEKCKNIIDSVKDSGKMYYTNNLNVLEESYIDANIELEFGIEMPNERNEYFETTEDIQEYIKGRIQ